MSSSLRTPSTSRLLTASKTTTFHCKDHGLSLKALGSQTGTAYFSSSCRPHGLKNDYGIRYVMMGSICLVVLTFLLYCNCRGSHGYSRTEGNDAVSSQPAAEIFKLLIQHFETFLEPPNVDSDQDGLVSASCPTEACHFTRPGIRVWRR